MGFKTVGMMVGMMDGFMCMCMFMSSLACMFGGVYLFHVLDVMASLVICHANLSRARRISRSIQRLLSLPSVTSVGSSRGVCRREGGDMVRVSCKVVSIPLGG